MNRYPIEQIADTLNESVSTLRYWTKIGLVGPSAKRTVGRRVVLDYTLRDAVLARSVRDLRKCALDQSTIRRCIQELKLRLPTLESEVRASFYYFDGSEMGVLSPPTRLPMKTMTFCWSGQELAETLGKAKPLRTKKPLSARDAFERGVAAMKDGDQVGAETHFQACIKKEPRFAAALSNLGMIFSEQGRRGDAKEYFLRALDSDPFQPEARYNLACIYEDVGDTDSAIEELRMVCRQGGELPDAHFNLARLLLGCGSVVQSKAQLERFLELEPCGSSADSARKLLSNLRRESATMVMN